MSETTFMGVERNKIDWKPTIDYTKCDYCMECDKFCPHQVFEVRETEDIKLIGVDDSPFCQFLPIQLSSVSGETVKRGRLAMDLLLKMRDGKEVKNISLDPVLKIRRSSGGK